MSEVIAEVVGKAGRITLNRPKALNALSLDMLRELTAALLAWRDDPRVEVVTIRGTGKEGPFGAFCAGGDLRFFHAARNTRSTTWCTAIPSPTRPSWTAS